MEETGEKMKQSSGKILKILEKNREILKQFGVQKLGLFGSAVRGEESADSDLDFLVEFEKKSFDRYMDLKFLLEELFQRPVDLVLADNLKPRLRPYILNEVIYAQGL